MTAVQDQHVRWLTPAEMAAWRGYIVGSALLDYRLNRELQDEHDVTLPDYEILVRLSEQPGHRMRMTQLATDVASSKSRVSHQIGRLEANGLVRRELCASDGRGVWAVLTGQGHDALVAAAPTHLRGVREHLVDHLTPAQQETLREIFDGITARLRP